jgi:hypothetical protein
MSFKKATKKQCKLRAGFMGIAGSGKTFSALRLATGLGGKIAVIDTERKSASKYADRFDFDVCELEFPTIENMVKIIKEAEALGYNVLIIDSLTHAWKMLLEEVEKLTATRFEGNSFRAWGVATPIQRQFIDVILKSNLHIITTMRVKTEYVIELNHKGKQAPKRIGLSAEQGKDIEYEFDFLVMIDGNHSAEVIKDRSGKFHDEYIERITEETGKTLADWLEVGEIEELTLMPEDILKNTLALHNINVKDFCNHFDIKKSNIAEKIVMLDAMVDEYLNEQ